MLTRASLSSLARRTGGFGGGASRTPQLRRRRAERGDFLELVTRLEQSGGDVIQQRDQPGRRQRLRHRGHLSQKASLRSLDDDGHGLVARGHRFLDLAHDFVDAGAHAAQEALAAVMTPARNFFFDGGRVRRHPIAERGDLLGQRPAGARDERERERDDDQHRGGPPEAPALERVGDGVEQERQEGRERDRDQDVARAQESEAVTSTTVPKMISGRNGRRIGELRRPEEFAGGVGGPSMWASGPAPPAGDGAGPR